MRFCVLFTVCDSGVGAQIHHFTHFPWPMHEDLVDLEAIKALLLLAGDTPHQYTSLKEFETTIRAFKRRIPKGGKVYAVFVDEPSSYKVQRALITPHVNRGFQAVVAALKPYELTIL